MLCIRRRDSSHRDEVIEIPEEILDLIMDKLYVVKALVDESPSSQSQDRAEGRSAVRTCLFVSKVFRHYALPRLYHRVIISNESLGRANSRISLLHQVIKPLSFRSTLGGVGPYIKQIIFQFAPNAMEYEDLMTRPLQLHMHTTVDHELDEFFSKRELAMVINELRQKEYGVRSFALDLSATVRGQRWPKFSDMLQKAIRRLILSPHLKSLTIRGVAYLPPDFLEGSTISDVRLQAFSDDYVNFLHGRFAAEWVMRVPSNLEKLYTDNTYRYDDPTSLKVLTVHVGLARFPMTEGIVKASAISLDHLNLTYYDNPEVFLKLHPTFRIDMMPNLKSFTYNQGRGINHMAPCLFHHILDTAESMGRLEILNIQAVFIPQSSNENEGHVEDDPGWEKLDILLSGVKYPALQRVKITTSLHPLLLGDPVGVSLKEGEPFPRIADAIVRKSFPCLSKTNLLLLTVRRF
ncbi:hypothetical protein CPC08DRAFT_822518 [Agrocybe pediades]|nr:hypothetical protein CPC08DRAFT_822518 [Agrocybe pediades]